LPLSSSPIVVVTVSVRCTRGSPCSYSDSSYS
jgi:hypothetical protein